MVDVKPWSQNKNYLIFSDGRIYSLYRYKFLEPDISNSGYFRVCLICKGGEQKHFSVHRLVAETFIDNPLSKPQVNHKDENKLNNDVSNLEWVLPVENANYGTRNERMRNASQTKKVVMCDKTTKEEQMIFDSVSDAYRYFGKPVSGHIAAVCKGTRNYALGHYWKYLD